MFNFSSNLDKRMSREILLGQRHGQSKKCNSSYEYCKKAIEI